MIDFLKTSLICLTLTVSCQSWSEAEGPYRAWQNMIEETEFEGINTLNKVNRFFNNIEEKSDIDNWGQKDHWATPKELLEKQAGDCEDFVFSKYFSLIALGVDPEKMRMTYVKSLTLNRAHMVLAYYRAPNTEPLILDNLDPTIKRAAARKDLVPVYSFNMKGMWVQSKTGHPYYAGTVDQYDRWQALLYKMRQQGLNEWIFGSINRRLDKPTSNLTEK